MPHPPRQAQNDERPTLPSIRDLFREELSRRPATPQFSPSSALARLDVNDEDDRESVNRYYNPPSHSYSKPSSGHPPHPTNVHPERYPPPHVSSRRSDSSTYPGVRSNTFPTNSQYNALGMYGVPTRSISTDESSSSHHRQMNPHPQHYSRPYDPSDPTPATSSYHPNRHPQARFSESSPPLLNIATSSRSRDTIQDDERTPINRFGVSPATSTGNLISVSRYPQEDIAGAAGKYECEYCGKGFTRPSSLKIHLNSHTGEKPFTCPVEGCGRSFSVLSNMRRHTRVHAATPGDAGNDDGQTQSVSLSYTQRWTQRRDSSASFSSENSRSSRSLSSDGDGE